MGKSIRTSVLFRVSLTLFSILAIFTAIVSYLSSEHIKNREYESIRNLAHSFANRFNSELTEYYSAGQTLTDILEGVGPISRENVNNILVNILEENPRLMGAYAHYEPNKFDNSDYKFRNTPGNDSTGRFLPYWNKLREKGKITLETGVWMDTSSWYLIPKNTGQPHIFEPYKYEGLSLISFIFPIMKDKKFIGIAGVDAIPSAFDEIVSNIKVFETGYAMLVSNNTLFVSAPDKELIGLKSLMTLGQEKNNPEIINTALLVKSGIEGITETIDPFTGKKIVLFNAPIELNKWSLLIVVPKKELFASVNKLFWTIIFFGVSIIIIINLLVYLSINNMLSPILDLSKKALGKSKEFKTLSKSDPKVKLDYEPLNEIEILERSFDLMTNNITNAFNELDSFFSNTPDGIIVFDTYKIVIRVNRAFEKIFGWKKEEIQGRTLPAIPEDRQSVFDKTFARVLSDKKTELYEERRRRKDGRTIYVSVTLTPIIDQHGNVGAIAAIVRDITEEKKNNVELIKAKVQAEKADKLKSEFLAQMSHEIRTPINTILNFTSLIHLEFKEKKFTGEIEEYFSSVDNAARRLIRTIDLILNMSEIEHGTYTLKHANVSIANDIITPILSEFKQKAHYHGIELNFLNYVKDKKVYLDEYSVTQIAANLVDNAIKYTPKGKVDVSVYANGKNWFLEVRDTGIGISKEYLPTLFTTFSQEEQGYSRPYDGSGLGLALVKKYCDINNANIKVTSKKGAGTTFKVSFSL